MYAENTGRQTFTRKLKSANRYIQAPEPNIPSIFSLELQIANKPLNTKVRRLLIHEKKKNNHSVLIFRYIIFRLITMYSCWAQTATAWASGRDEDNTYSQRFRLLGYFYRNQETSWSIKRDRWRILTQCFPSVMKVLLSPTGDLLQVIRIHWDTFAIEAASHSRWNCASQHVFHIFEGPW